jgi:chromosome partitioning protein
MSQSRARVIAIGNQKGGVAKTTTAVQLAAALAEKGRRCLVWDLDMNCGSTQHFGIPDSMSILGTYEVMLGEEQPADVIVKAGELPEVDLPERLDLLPARRKLEAIEQSLISKWGRFTDVSAVLKEPLESIRADYDYIFLDTAPNLTTPTIAAYKSADYFLLSAMPETFAIQGLSAALQDIKSVRERGGTPNLTLLGVIIGNVDGRQTKLAQDLLAYVEETFGKLPPWMRKYETTISRTTIISTAQKAGKTIFQTEPRHKVTEQFRALAVEFEARVKQAGQGGALQPTPAQAGQVGEVAAHG